MYIEASNKHQEFHHRCQKLLASTNLVIVSFLFSFLSILYFQLALHLYSISFLCQIVILNIIILSRRMQTCATTHKYATTMYKFLMNATSIISYRIYHIYFCLYTVFPPGSVHSLCYHNKYYDNLFSQTYQNFQIISFNKHLCERYLMKYKMWTNL